MKNLIKKGYFKNKITQIIIKLAKLAKTQIIKFK